MTPVAIRQLAVRLIPRAGDAHAGAALRKLLDHALEVPAASAVAEPFLPLLARPDRSVRAVLLYGSCLWPALRGATSQPDFFVVVDSLRAWHRRLSHQVFNACLPPSIYRLRAGTLEAKLSVTSAAQLQRHCSAAAPDLHHMGRFSKRIALVWSRDDACRRSIVDAQAAALATLASLARARLGDEVHVDELMLTLLSLSYEAEVRIAEHGKARALFDAEPAHYRAVGRELMTLLGGVSAPDALTFRLPPVASSPKQVDQALRRSRRRAVLRWPKYIYTYDGWLDYVLAKLARTGERWSLTPRQKQHPLLFGLPVVWQLARARRLT
jgi:hypothetical protein